MQNNREYLIKKLNIKPHALHCSIYKQQCSCRTRDPIANVTKRLTKTNPFTYLAETASSLVFINIRIQTTTQYEFTCVTAFCLWTTRRQTIFTDVNLTRNSLTPEWQRNQIFWWVRTKTIQMHYCLWCNHELTLSFTEQTASCLDVDINITFANIYRDNCCSE